MLFICTNGYQIILFDLRMLWSNWPSPIPHQLLPPASDQIHSFYALDRSSFYPSVYFSVISTTLWSLLHDEPSVDIRSSMSHTSFGPSHITLFFEPPARFNLRYQQKFLLFQCLFLRRAHHSMVAFLRWIRGLYSPLYVPH